MKPLERILLVGALVSTAGAGIYFWTHRLSGESPILSKPSEPNIAKDVEPKVQYPVSPEEETGSAASDRKEPTAANYTGQTLESALTDLIGLELFGSIFNLDAFANRIVVAVENMTSPAQLSPEHSPVKPPESIFVAIGKGDRTSISPDNFKRYAPYIELAKTVDPNKLVAIYVHFYPQLQAAYHDLGTDKYFNDRVVEVINHLLKTPEVAGFPRLVQPSPHNRYKYADDGLENLSSSQKVLIRMGSENADIVKAKLRRIRRLLVHLGKEKQMSLTRSRIEDIAEMEN